ncbi:MAG: DeoR/GlpR family DNA-binding transcription regulator [Clostridiales bacterium]|nr:DeoR/GlpR family DNA-binding transcription regulator [Clostridiales bacterium]
MLAVERRNAIEQIINENGSVMVTELAKRFEVTSETIRADLLKLERQGVLVRTYGGATLVDNSGNELAIAERDIINYEEKQRIGKRAAKMVRDGETIFLDASTSAWHMARYIKDKRGITVITNASKIAYELSECADIHVVQTGGELNPKNMSYVGRIAEKTIREHYFADKMFFSCKGVTLLRGLVDSSADEAEIKKAMLKNSEAVIFLCDHNKMGTLAVSGVADFEDLDCFITDVNLSEEWTERLNKAEVRIITV